jgi:hypothetical protein
MKKLGFKPRYFIGVFIFNIKKFKKTEIKKIKVGYVNI